ncbi:MAG: hypothetical protein Q7R87_04995 [Nanoarchaeota archaeon]|nr:hypothetical protein [Nanoarchaeota archaeon]
MKRGFEMNKKGLSDVITNVLVIVLVIAAIGILWAALKPTIQKGAESTEQAGCYQIDLAPVTCVRNDIAGDTANLTYKWVSGDYELIGTKLVLGKEDGSSTSQDDSGITPLSTVAKNDVDFGGKPKQFSVAAVIKSTSGKSITCQASQPILCA